MIKSSNNLIFPSNLTATSEKKRVLMEANSILRHEFQVLDKKIKFPGKINWHSNFANKSWPKESYLDFRKNNYDFDSERYIGDIKLPWELNKHLYFQDLAKAYLITKDEKYTREFINEIEDWLKSNPYEVGVNWTEGLIASHRVISWIIALSAFIKSKNVSGNFLKEVSNSIYQHALFIEKTYEFCGRASNHLLGELCAQILISTIFPEFKGSKRRLIEATHHLQKELKLQVYPDGVDYEQSLSYQRVILEFLYLPVILEKRKLLKLPREIIQTTEKMTEFLMHMTQPNGLLQPISDADGARVFVLGNDINDFRPHLSLAAWLFNRSDFKFVAERYLEPTKWFLSPAELMEYKNLPARAPEKESKAFSAGGYWISRSGWQKTASWLFFDCGYMGMGEWPPDLPVGVHGHSDTLNFGLAVGGETFITDNGSYSYTTERPFHRYFRSSIAHNLPIIDGQDENEIDPRPWIARQFALPQNPSFVSTAKIDYLAGEHTGYLRLRPRVLARRELLHFKEKQFLILKDSFYGSGRHQIDEVFHFIPGINLKKTQGKIKVLGKKTNFLILLPARADAKIFKGKTNPVDGWHAPTYGQKLPAPSLHCTLKTEGQSSFYFVFSWGRKVPQNFEQIFEETLQKIQKPKVLILATGHLSSSPGLQKEAFAVSRDGNDVRVLTYVIDDKQNFYHPDFAAREYLHESFSLRLIISRWLGKKILNWYAKYRYFALFCSLLGRLRSVLRAKTYDLIGNDINQPTDHLPVKMTGSSRNSKQGLYYSFRLNRILFKEGSTFSPDIIIVKNPEARLAGRLIKKKSGAKLIYDDSKKSKIYL